MIASVSDDFKIRIVANREKLVKVHEMSGLKIGCFWSSHEHNVPVCLFFEQQKQ